MEGHLAFDFEKCDSGDSKAGGAKKVKGCKIGTVARKKLAEISNAQQQSKLMNRDSKQHHALLVSSDHVGKLYQENMTLMKVVAERNKVIESSGMEFQKLMVNFQKVQQQNSQLAQANSQMLAELNSGKDKLRVLQHELGCTNGLLKARKSENERKEKTATEPSTKDEAVEYSSVDNAEKQSYRAGRRRQSKGSSLDNSVLNIEKVEDKSASRRRSSRFKAEEPRPTRELFQIDEAKFPFSSLADDPEKVNCSNLQGSEPGKEEKGGDMAIKYEIQENRGLLVGRPLRRAVEKIQSYKEIPLNVKMRRDNCFAISCSRRRSRYFG